MEKTDIYWYAMSDKALLAIIDQFFVDEIAKIIGQWMIYAERQKVPDDIAKAIKYTLLA